MDGEYDRLVPNYDDFQNRALIKGESS
jgi:hypothetical protein